MTDAQRFGLVLSEWLGDAKDSGLAQLAHDLWHSSDDCRVLASAAGKLVACSELVGNWVRLQNALVPGVIFADLVHDDDTAAWRQFVAAPQQGRSLEVRLATQDPAAPWFWVAISLRAYHDEEQRIGYFFSLRDLSEIKHVQQRLLHQANYDELTQLPNRAYFLKFLSERIQQLPQGEHFAVLFVDLDRFKIINDALGHSVGDTLLQKAALRLLQCIGEGSVLSRFGGDEFLISLAAANSLAQAEQRAEAVAKRILRELAPGIVVGADTLHVTASIGIGVYPEDSKTAEGVIQAADIAMYVVKSRGKNGFARHAAAMDNELFVRTRLEQELRQALADERLEVHYQPQASLRDGRVFGVEALARWQHPRLGAVEPAVFLELAEASGIARAIDNFVQNRALADAAQWQQQGLKVAVSVNISSAQIKQADFVAAFRESLQRANVEPSMVKVELVETALLEGDDDILQKLRGIKAMGVELAIDDFGTGYSSLSYLQQFPIDWLKIDRSFIAELKDGANTVLMDAILAMGKGLNMQLLAEGVEKTSQLDYLQANGCDAVQGFLIAPAVTSVELPALLTGERIPKALIGREFNTDLSM